MTAIRLNIRFLLMFIVLLSLVTSSQVSSDTVLTEQTDRKPKLQKDPCWFRIPEGQLKTKKDEEAYDEYMRRQTSGYPADISLSEAVKTFNKETFCRGIDPKRSMLKEDEVIASAIGEMVKGSGEPVSPSLKPTSPERKAALEKIWREKIMPKGSLLVAEGAYDKLIQGDNEAELIRVDCWEIYIYIGLDTNSTESKYLRPDQVCLVRKNCFGVRKSRY